MVSRDGYVKVLDFGLAKLTEPQTGEVSAMPTLARPETHPGTILGTVGYMSPEQASGRPLDFRSDQFSFGSILYKILSGQKAFARKTGAETMSAIIREDPEPLGKLRPETPPPLRWIIERCLAKDPDERYASTRDLARELAGVRDHISEISGGAEAIIGGPVRPGKRLAPLLMAAGLLLTGLGAGVFLAAKFWKKAPARAPSFHRLTFRSGVLHNARFAADGQTIVYGATWQGEPNRMYSTRPESPESRPFEFPNADILAISSAGEMAVLLREKDGSGIVASVSSRGGKPEHLVLLPTGAGESRVMNERLENFRGAASLPDGRKFVFAAQEKGHGPRIHIQSLEGGDPLPVSPEGVFIRPSTNALTPDGKFVLGSSGAKVSLYPLEGGPARAVAGLEVGDVPVQWSEDGRSLFVHHLSGLPNKVWLLDPANGKKQPWLEIKPGESLGGVGVDVLLTRDGKSYVYGTPRVFSELYVVEGLR